MTPTSQPEPTRPAPRRRPGAPIRNTNALKHGFYSSRFKKKDLSDLDGHEFFGLQDEIIMLRVLIRQVVEICGSVNNADQAISFLRAMSLATISLTRLLRTQHLLQPGKQDPTQALNEALEEVIAEMGIGTQPPGEIN